MQPAIVVKIEVAAQTIDDLPHIPIFVQVNLLILDRSPERLVGKCSSKQITQNIIDQFILQRGSEVKRPTLNKDIRNMKTFINWCRENRYLNGNLKIKELKEDERPVKSLNDVQIKKLLAAAETYPSIKMRILLALGTGLRRGDIESLKINDIDFGKNSITTMSRKTRKSMGLS